MNVIIIESEAFTKLKQELADCVLDAYNKLLQEKGLREGSDWITIDEARKLLPLKSKTSWQKLRDHGKVRFTQTGRVILYSRQSIIDYLLKNKVGF